MHQSNDMTNLYSHHAVSETKRKVETTTPGAFNSIGSMGLSFVNAMLSSDYASQTIARFGSTESCFDFLLNTQDSLSFPKLEQDPTIHFSPPSGGGATIGKPMPQLHAMYFDGLPPVAQQTSTTSVARKRRRVKDDDSSYDTPSTYSEDSGGDYTPKKRKASSTKSSNAPKTRAGLSVPESQGDQKSVMLQDKDVICQRGALTNHHLGNKIYLAKVEERKAEYQSTNEKKQKTYLSELVIDDVLANGGRFVRKDEDTGKWFVVDRKIVRTKVSQALREANTAESRAAKRQRYPKKRRR